MRPEHGHTTSKHEPTKEVIMKTFTDYCQTCAGAGEGCADYGQSGVITREVCPQCFGTGGAIGSGYEKPGEPCHAGPYAPWTAPRDRSPLNPPAPALSWRDDIAAVECNRCREIVSTDQQYYELDPNTWLHCDCSAAERHCDHCDGLIPFRQKCPNGCEK